MWKWGSRAEGRRRGQAVDEAWLRPEDEAEGGTPDDSLFLWGWGLLIEGWAGAGAGVRSEEVDLDPALRVGRARRQPGRAAPRHHLEVQAARAGILRLCQTPRCQEEPGAAWPTENKGLFEGSGLWGQG